jgi:hypothetical protein
MVHKVIGVVITVALLAFCTLTLWQCDQKLVRLKEEVLPCRQEARDNYCRDKGYKKALAIPVFDTDGVFQCITQEDQTSESYVTDAVNTSRCPKL